MSATVSATVRDVIKGDVNVPADDIVRKVKAKGVTASESSIREAIYNVKSALRKAAKKNTAKPKPSKPAPAAARETKQPEVVATVAPVAVAAPVAPDLRAVFANVALVNGVLDACGGVDGARKVVEAVRACGGVEPFLMHLDLVAQVRGATA
jgi:hypothetical protein